MKPWALGDLIIGDELNRLGTWFSVLRDARGLNDVQARLSERPGRYPLLAGLGRPGRRIAVEHFFQQSTDALRDAARTLLMRQCATARNAETPLRLVSVENVLPGIGAQSLVRAFGPWDVRYDGGWTVRDLFDEASGDLASGWAIDSGEGLDVSGSSAFTLANTDLSGVNAVEVWWKPSDANTYASNRYLFDGGSLELYFRASDDKFVLTDGTTTVTSAVQTFAADTLIHVVAVFGSTYGTYLYVDNVSVNGSGNAVSLAATCYVGTDAAAALPERGQLVAVRFYTTLTATQVDNLYDAGVAASDDPLGDARWLEVVPERVQPLSARGKVTMHLVTTMAISKDARWRSRDGDYQHWDVTGAEAHSTVIVTSDDQVRPLLYITPKSAKSGGFTYAQFVQIQWDSENAADDYPVGVIAWDTATLISASKMQSDGDDLRVYVDGVEVDRWLSGINTASTNVWWNVEFEPKQEATLGVAIAGSGSISTITASTDISGFPTHGLLLIDSEMFAYDGKINESKQFLNVTRSVRGTSAAAHTTTDTIYWIQHEVWVYYGDASLSAPSVDGDYEPVFELDTSTNAAWDYEEFGEDGKPTRPGTWSYEVVSGLASQFDAYNGDRGAAATPWIEIGIKADIVAGIVAQWLVHNPCGISNTNFTNGEQNITGASRGSIQSSEDGATWTSEYTLPAGTGAWQAWSRSEAITSGALYVALRLTISGTGTGSYYLEAADCTMTVGDDPTVSLIGEQSNYELDCEIENGATGDKIALSLSMVLDQVVEVDTDLKTVINRSEGSRHRSALTLASGPRAEWLPLLNGANALTYTESGVADVDIDIVWDRRYFE